MRVLGYIFTIILAGLLAYGFVPYRDCSTELSCSLAEAAKTSTFPEPRDVKDIIAAYVDRNGWENLIATLARDHYRISLYEDRKKSDHLIIHIRKTLFATQFFYVSPFANNLALTIVYKNGGFILESALIETIMI